MALGFRTYPLHIHASSTPRQTTPEKCCEVSAFVSFEFEDSPHLAERMSKGCPAKLFETYLDQSIHTIDGALVELDHSLAP